MYIGILKCDTASNKTQEEFGDYDNIFKTLLNKDNNITVKCFDCISMQFPTTEDFNNLDGVIITGSRHSAYLDIEWMNKLRECIVKMDKLKLKLVGICFGHQIIASALGGIVKTNNEGWEVAVNPIYLNSLGSEIFGGKNLLQINQMHKDIVDYIPPETGLKIIAYNYVCQNQGMIKDDYILTLQGHPEYVPTIIKNFIDDRRDIIGEKVYYDGMSKLHKEPDTDVFVNAIMDFFQN